MELKEYQQQALETLDRYLEALKEAHLQLDKVAKILSPDEVPDSLRNYPLQAWESLRKKSGLPGVPDMKTVRTIFQNIFHVRRLLVNRSRMSA